MTHLYCDSFITTELDSRSLLAGAYQSKRRIVTCLCSVNKLWKSPDCGGEMIVSVPNKSCI